MKNVEELEIPITGYSVVADWYESKANDKILLMLIGYNSSRKRKQELINNFVSKSNYSILTFDFSGMGDSPLEFRNTSPAQHFLETVRVFDWIKNKYPKADISVLGSSYGGYLAAYLTQYRSFSNLLLLVPAMYTAHSFYNLQPLVHTKEAARIRSDRSLLNDHPVLVNASDYKGKTLVVAHGKDKVIPKQTTDAYAKAFNADFYVQPEFTHSLRDPSNPKDKFDEYENFIANWLKK